MERWYGTYLYLIVTTSLLAVLYCWMTEWDTTAVIIAYGAMAVFSGICFMAESAVMGFTAKAGAFFWTGVTCVLVCKYLPIGVAL